MLFGGILIVLTLVLDSHHGPEDLFNYAYVTGVLAIAVLFASFYLFYRGKGRSGLP